MEEKQGRARARGLKLRLVPVQLYLFVRPELFAAVTAPITALSFTDDEVLSPESTEFLHGLYTGSEQVHRHLSPSDVGVERLGHHGFFRRQGAHLWDELVIPAIAVTERDGR